MAKTLIICGHPNYKASVANRAILDEMKKLVPDSEIVILSELYPDFKIDIAREQKRLGEADTVIFDYPMQWFDAPSLMHRYVEEVFAFGFAYGPGGTALKGKNFILSFTTGAPEKMYTDGPVTMQMFMTPMLAIPSYTGMDNREPVISYAMSASDPNDKKAVDAVVEKGREHAKRLAKLIG